MEKSKLNIPLDNSNINSNLYQNSINVSFINNININTSANLSFISENNERPATYTKRLLAKYYKFVDNYNKKNTNEKFKSSKDSTLNESKCSKISNKK
jgi:hypothetical protein